MSKFFFKGRIEKKPKHNSFGYNTNREVKPGTDEQPLALSVQSEERKVEVEALLAEHSLVATIAVDSDQPENIDELLAMTATPKTIVLDKTPNRNDPCSCGSEKKYKKCCGK